MYYCSPPSPPPLPPSPLPLPLLSPSQTQEHSFTWDMIGVCEADIEDQALTFTILREGKDPRWIRVFSPCVR